MSNIFYHRRIARARVTHTLKQHGIDPDKYQWEIDSLIGHKTTYRLLELLVRASQGEDVSAEGDERSRLILGIVLGINEHVTETCKGSGVEPSPFALRTVEILSELLAEFRKH